MRAVCARCGAGKTAFDEVCGACGHRPEGEGLLVSWLLSDAHLNPAQLEASSTRLRAGEFIRPNRSSLAKARKALQRQLTTDPGLSALHLVGLLGLNVVFSPLVGWVCAWSWRSSRPRAALQAALVSLPVSIAGTLVFVFAYNWAGA